MQTSFRSGRCGQDRRVGLFYKYAAKRHPGNSTHYFRRGIKNERPMIYTTHVPDVWTMATPPLPDPARRRHSWPPRLYGPSLPMGCVTWRQGLYNKCIFQEQHPAYQHKPCNPRCNRLPFSIAIPDSNRTKTNYRCRYKACTGKGADWMCIVAETDFMEPDAASCQPPPAGLLSFEQTGVIFILFWVQACRI